ncbi:hypothetical protein BGW38_007174, partial [Lunasporangiospora selenospora]
LPLESLNQSWEPSAQALSSAGPHLSSPPASSSSSPSMSGSHPPSLAHHGSGSNPRALASVSSPHGPGLVSYEADQLQSGGGSGNNGSDSGNGGGEGGPGSSVATQSNDAATAQQHLQTLSTQHDPNDLLRPRDSTNYKVPVPPSPVVSPRMGPAAGMATYNNFNFLNSDPTLQRSSSKKRAVAPPIQVQTGQSPQPPQPYLPSQQPQQQQSPAFSPQGILSPVSPGRRHPYHRWENILPPQHQDPGRDHFEHGQGQGQDNHEDGDYEDEDNNDDTDGDFLSGPEDPQGDRRNRQHRRQRSNTDGNTIFTPTRSAPQPPSFNGAPATPNSREAEIAHIMYIQQQQALFLKEKALNPPLRQKASNGNLSGGNSDGPKPRQKGSRHRKQISVISEPKLLSSTNQVRTVPIVRAADASDNDDAGTKSEYTSGGEGIKRTVRRMKKAVRHAATNVFHDDDSDREDGIGSKSDAEKKGGLKQLKALKSKLAKKLHRPSHGGSPSSSAHSSRYEFPRNGVNPPGDDDGSGRAPVQFFSEDNLRSRYLAQEQQGGLSLAAAGVSLRRSNTTRDNTGSMNKRYEGGDKEEYDSQDEQANKSTNPQDNENGADGDAAAKDKMTKFGSRTFEKEEMMEVKDGNGESFFVPRWEIDPRADELGSSKSVISVQSSRKLERSTSNVTAISNAPSSAGKPSSSITERLQSVGTVEEEKDDNANALTHQLPPASANTVSDPKVIEAIISGKGTDGSGGLQLHEEKDQTVASKSGHEDPSLGPSSGLTSRTSTLSETSSNVSSVAGIIVAQVLTRQNSTRKNFKRPGMENQGQEGNSTGPKSPHLGLGISLPSPSKEKEKQLGVLDEVSVGPDSSTAEMPNVEKQLPPLPHEDSKTSPPTVRPLSPIRRGANSNSPASLSSISSIAASSDSTNSILEQSRGVLRHPSLGSITLPQAPTSPLPSPGIQPPSGASPAMSGPPTFPAVLMRQGSQMTERASIRSMYADSIYDCYDYDSSSELESQVGVELPQLPRQNSLGAPLTHSVEAALAASTMVPVAVTRSLEQEKEYIDGSVTVTPSSPVSPRATVTTSALREQVEEITTVVNSSSSSMTQSTEDDKRSTVIATPNINIQNAENTVETSTLLPPSGSNEANTELPTVRLRSPRIPRAEPTSGNPEAIKEEEHHVHYEDLPRAVEYRMSIMTTVPVEPVGVAPSLALIPGHSSNDKHLNAGGEGRSISLHTLSIASDLTTETWMSSSTLSRSSSVRNTRDDLAGWEAAEDNRGRRRERSLDIPRTDARLSLGSLSEGSLMEIPVHGDDYRHADKTSSRLDSMEHGSDEHGRDIVVSSRRSRSRSISMSRGVEQEVLPRHRSGLSVAESGSSRVNRKQWIQDRRRETWGSLKSMESSASEMSSSSGSSSASSHFYFNGRSPSPSPSES